MSYNKETGMFEGYIYKIINDINDKIYIGQTIQTIDIRFKGHVYSCKNRKDENSAIHHAMNKYGIEHFKVLELEKCIAETKEELIQQLNVLERYYIKAFNTTVENRQGYNIDEGGQTQNACRVKIDVYHISGTFIETMPSILETENKYNCSIVSEICNGKIGNFKCLYVFRYHNDSFDLYDFKTPVYQLIYQFSLQGELVSVHYNYEQAIYSVTEKYSNAIRLSIDNPYMQAYGYWWSSTNSFNYKGWKNKRGVDLYDCKTLKFISAFPTVTACAEYIGTSTRNVSAMCKGEKYSLKGYIARYQGDDVNKYRVNQNGDFTIKRINLYSIDDTYINTFNGITDACNNIFPDGRKCSTTSITGCLKHRYGCKTAYGYKWFYVDDETQPDKTKIIKEAS